MRPVSRFLNPASRAIERSQSGIWGSVHTNVDLLRDAPPFEQRAHEQQQPVLPAHLQASKRKGCVLHPLTPRRIALRFSATSAVELLCDRASIHLGAEIVRDARRGTGSERGGRVRGVRTFGTVS
eukprot:2701221-Pleurochrysis_carterae.AAC.2